MALSADKPLENTFDAPRYDYPVLAATTIYAGGMVAIDATGYAIPAELTAGIKIVGVAREYVDNSAGADAAKNVRVHAGMAVWYDNDTTNAVDQADLGDVCYVFDDETVRDYVGGGVNVIAGTVMDLDATKGVLVWIDLPSTTSGTIVGNLSVGGALAVTGASTFTGAIDLDGGATVATGQTIAGDAELTLVAAAGSDLVLTNTAGAGDTIVNLGDAAGAQKLSIVDSGSVEVARIDSDGNVQCDGTLAVAGIATFTAEADFDGGLALAAGQAIEGDGALSVGVTTGAFDLTLNMGDAAGAQKVSFTDSADVEVARIDSDGNFQCDGTATIDGAATLASAVITAGATVGTTLAVTGVLTCTAEADFDGGLALAAGQAIEGDGDMEIGVSTGAFDLTLNMGDNAGAQAVLFTDSDDVEVASLDSAGNFQCDGTAAIDGVATLASAVITAGATVGTTLGVTGVADFDAGITVAAGQAITGDGALTIATTGAVDLDITAGAGGEIVVQMGDNGGANGISFVDDAAAEVAALDSDGAFSCVGLNVSGTQAVLPMVAMTLGAVPTQANMVTAFGAAADGKSGIIDDDTPGAMYYCVASAARTWHYVTMTVGA